jgi:ADP-heptose:LPS heptosyltransferase
MLAKRSAELLLLHSGLVDEVIPFDFPWTAFTNKYSPSRYDKRRFDRLFHDLRARDFDVSLDARRDIRSNIVTYLSGARRRIGYDFGGGSHLLTDVLPSGDQNAHKIEDWLALLGPLNVPVTGKFRPRLVVTEAERSNARDRLKLLGLSSSAPIIAVHPGASHAVRRWDKTRFGAVLDETMANGESQVIIFEETRGDSAGIVTSRAVPRIHTGLRELMGLIAESDLLLCNDSGPMHIAEALDVPVVALFGGSRSEWYGPRGNHHSVIQVDEMECRPCFDACIFATPRCMEGISSDRVISTLRTQLARTGSQRIARPALAG